MVQMHILANDEFLFSVLYPIPRLTIIVSPYLRGDIYPLFDMKTIAIRE